MVEIEYSFSPENLSDRQVIFPCVIPVKKPYCSPVLIGTEKNPATASRYLCFYRVNTNSYYGAFYYYGEMEEGNQRVVVSFFVGPYEFSSEIPPNFVIPLPDKAK